MINVTQHGWEWDLPVEHGTCPSPSVWHSPAERVSELLGPDGEPITVGYERPAIGFDLRPRRLNCNKDSSPDHFAGAGKMIGDAGTRAIAGDSHD